MESTLADTIKTNDRALAASPRGKVESNAVPASITVANGDYCGTTSKRGISADGGKLGLLIVGVTAIDDSLRV